MTDRYETCWDCKTAILLSFMKISNLYSIDCCINLQMSKIGCVNYAHLSQWTKHNTANTICINIKDGHMTKLEVCDYLDK